MDTKVHRVGQAAKTPNDNTFYRYSQLALLVIAAGSIYPVLYLRQIYQSSMLVALNIDNQQLGYLYSGLGTAFVLSYLPSGWLADRLPPRLLICISLLGTGLLALWYATYPSYGYLRIIFFGFGITTGLTFWAALLKRLKTLATKEEQGRFFGMLDGGRGLIEASLATIALTMFTYYTKTQGESLGDGFQRVLHLYAYLCLALGIVLTLLRDPNKTNVAKETKQQKKGRLLDDLKTLARLPELWLMTTIVFCGYHLFWATYSFSAYLEQGSLGLTATVAATITTAKMWMRPIGGIGGGWLGDRFTNLRVLTIVLSLGTLGIGGLILAPMLHSVALAAGLILFIGLMVYAIRGLYWAILDICHVPAHTTGLAIGIVSVIGYSPDILLPLINGWATQHFPGTPGYQIYYSYIATVGVFGVIAALTLNKRIAKRKAA
ncbi:MFS transporter [Dyella nitratireducens]|uniref:MFS transporter n=1 Tax=Dyella nitratireducens TaxID=1849580 RepID=A0ABQ1GMX4_9GAMM|nr:MFS transporter [Dyella nitratireducens]GGA46700.1 MFS transporter [Dyella nitratireducens]GLQ41484.1 MFS transporter [Dyella nitratireducens]